MRVLIIVYSGITTNDMAHCLPQGQVITIKAVNHPTTENERYFEAIYCFPKILHVCCEARREALLIYKPAFEDVVGYPVYLVRKLPKSAFELILSALGDITRPTKEK